MCSHRFDSLNQKSPFLVNLNMWSFPFSFLCTRTRPVSNAIFIFLSQIWFRKGRKKTSTPSFVRNGTASDVFMKDLYCFKFLTAPRKPFLLLLISSAIMLAGHMNGQYVTTCDLLSSTSTTRISSDDSENPTQYPSIIPLYSSLPFDDIDDIKQLHFTCISSISTISNWAFVKAVTVLVSHSDGLSSEQRMLFSKTLFLKFSSSRL
mmetsp:Transcript_9244/g.10722  ORF Transcript_9244/g.10722 Transcript_9244/m.10722 type:complete len:206 (-) Transcript_9244:240-857(-)